MTAMFATSASPNLFYRRPFRQIGEFDRHGRISPGQFFDCDILRFVVREAQIAVATKEGFLSLLQMVN